MKRIILILLILILFNNNVNARERKSETFPRFTTGVEWGYAAAVWEVFHYNFFSQEGYRVNEVGESSVFHNYGDMYLHAGYNFNENWNISLYAGYSGMTDRHKAVPIYLRGSRYFGKDAMKDRWFTFIDIGSGICLKKPVQEIIIGRLGGGYRISLSRDTKLDLMIALRMNYTHPEVFHEGKPIPHETVNRNDMYIGAISISMALTL